MSTPSTDVTPMQVKPEGHIGGPSLHTRRHTVSTAKATQTLDSPPHWSSDVHGWHTSSGSDPVLVSVPGGSVVDPPVPELAEPLPAPLLGPVESSLVVDPRLSPLPSLPLLSLSAEPALGSSTT